jgi:hypothetical protein
LIESVANGQAQGRDEYVNDMDGRGIREEALAIAPAEERALWMRVPAAEKKIRTHLKPSKDCLRDSREGHCWYYHEPQGRLS